MMQGCVCEEGFGFSSPGSNACTSCPQTSYTFPLRSTADYVVVDYDPPQLSQVSLCMVISPSTTAGEGLKGAIFSYATPVNANSFTIHFDTTTRHTIYFNHPSSTQRSINIEVTQATHICFLISKPDQYLKMYKDGSLFATRTYTDTDPLPDLTGSLIIGQEQDSVGSGFSTNQAFEGQVENLMLWERILSTTEILDMAGDKCVCSGDFDLALTSDVVTVNGNVVTSYPTC
ncbi:jeltraxin-like [Styela clava]